MFSLSTIVSRIMGVKEVQRQSIASFVGQISFTFIGFLSTMYFAHELGAEILGAYFLFTAYYGIIYMVTDGGLGGAATKRISEGIEPDAYFSAFFVLRLLLVIIVLIILVIFRKYLIDLDAEGVFIWLLLALIVSILHGAVNISIVGRGKIGIRAVSDLINNVSRVIFQVIAVFLGFNVAGLAGGFVAGMLISGIVQLRFFDQRFVRFRWMHVKSISTFSIWLFLTSAGVLLYSYADTIMIGYYMSNADVGVYRVAFQFSTFAAFTTVAIRAVLWPKVSRWGKIGEFRLIEEGLSRAFNYSLILAVPVFAGGTILGNKLLYFFYGVEFTKGYSVLVILLITQIVNTFQFFFTMYLGALDHQKDAFKVTAVAVTANIILNFILIPIIGIAGAAIATLVTMGLNAVLAQKILSKIITIKVEYTTVLNISKATIAMIIFIEIYSMLIPMHTVLLTIIPIISGGFLYVILVLNFDSKIHDELKGIAKQMELPWPDWL